MPFKVKHVAFFRNLNLGRAKCPNRAQFEAAFLRAGADSASSFLTNGTLVFSVPAGASARGVLAAAREQLEADCGLTEPVFLRTVRQLAGLVAQDPFASIDRGSVHSYCISFLAPGRAPLPAVPMRSRRGDVEVLRIARSEALSLSLLIGNTPGSPNAFLEKTLGVPATTRVWNTVVRLVQRHA